MLLRAGLQVALFLSVLFAATTGASDNKGKIEGTKKWSKSGHDGQGPTHPGGRAQTRFRHGRLDGVLCRPQHLQGQVHRWARGQSWRWISKRNWRGKKFHVEKVTINGNRLTMTDGDGTQLAFEKANNRTVGARGAVSGGMDLSFCCSFGRPHGF